MPGHLGCPESVVFPFVIELDYLPELDNVGQAWVGGSRESPTYKLREDLHKLPQMVLVHITMEQMSVGRHIARFRVAELGIEGCPIRVDNDVTVVAISSSIG